MFNLRKKDQVGFTLIELLAVVAIIGILSSVVMASFSNARRKSRDAQRMSDVREIEKALNLYVNDTGTYPVSATPTTITGADPVSLALEGANSISEVPIDPRSPTYDYTYQTNATGSNFTISFCLETEIDSNFSQGCGNTITP